MSAGLRTLTDILCRAVEIRADSVQLEYDRGELEVYFVSGATGIGTVVDRDAAGQIVESIVEQARPSARRRGTMKFALGETEYIVKVRQYENFMEPAFELQIKPAK